MSGHSLIGSTLFHLGMLEASQEHVRKSLEAYGERSESAITLFVGPDISVFSRSYLSHLRWILGFPEQAIVESERAVAAARKLSHPFSLAVALNYAAIL